MSTVNSFLITLFIPENVIYKGICKIFSETDKYTISGIYSDFDMLVKYFEKNKSDILIYSISSNSKSTLEQISFLNSKFDTKVILLCTTFDKTIIQKCMKLGARGIIMTKCSDECIASSVENVLQGELYFCDDIKNAMFETYIPYSKPNNGTNNPLSLREKQVLSLIVDEYTSLEIAKKLSIGVTTVESHRRNITVKLGAKNIAGIVKIAILNGLVEL